jgi:mycofactocin precursor
MITATTKEDAMSSLDTARDEAAPVPAEPIAPPPEPAPEPPPALVEADLLVEDVSIDGMCGVY